jgi:hypothetical protein
MGKEEAKRKEEAMGDTRLECWRSKCWKLRYATGELVCWMGVGG